MNKDTLIKVINKYNGTVGYEVPDLGVHRNFYPRESKEVSFDELEKLSFTPGGDVILRDFLEITDEEAAIQLLHKNPQPEYHYTLTDITQVMINGTLDQFLDCLDFAPQAVRESIKDIAVELPLNDMAKRDAIREKLGFDVTKAIEIKNTKYDGDDENAGGTEPVTTRRAAAPKTNTATAAPTGRRYKPVPQK